MPLPKTKKKKKKKQRPVPKKRPVSNKRPSLINALPNKGGYTMDKQKTSE